MLLKGYIGFRAYTSSGSFSAKDFGSNGKMTAWKLVNHGTKDVQLFSSGTQSYVVPVGTETPWMTMPTGYYDALTYNFSFDSSGGNPGILIITAMASDDCTT